MVARDGNPTIRDNAPVKSSITEPIGPPAEMGAWPGSGTSLRKRPEPSGAGTPIAFGWPSPVRSTGCIRPESLCCIPGNWGIPGGGSRAPELLCPSELFGTCAATRALSAVARAVEGALHRASMWSTLPGTVPGGHSMSIREPCARVCELRRHRDRPSCRRHATSHSPDPGNAKTSALLLGWSPLFLALTSCSI